MIKIVFFFACCRLVSVTPNPIQGFQTCPITNTIQQPYRNPEPVILQANHFNGYPQQNLVQNQPNPIYPTNPLTINDQIKQVYLNRILANPSANTYLNSNAGVNYQNGFGMSGYNPNIQSELPKVVNNYIIVPPEYFANQTNFIKSDGVIPVQPKIVRSRNEIQEKQNFYGVPAQQNVDNKYDLKNLLRELILGETQNLDKERNDLVKYNNNQNNKKEMSTKRFSKKTKNRETTPKTNVTPAKGNSENNVQIIKPKEGKIKENVIDRPVNIKNNSLGSKRHNKTPKLKPKSPEKTSTPSNKKMKAPVEDIISKENIVIANDNVCFDINEDCIDLENRHTRNHQSEKSIKNKQQTFPTMPNDFSNNLQAYMNSFMTNHNLNTNSFNQPGSFPFNFDYLYQVPQHSNTKSTKSGGVKRNRKKKQKNGGENFSNRNERKRKIKPKNQEKIVELSPKYFEFGTTTEPTVINTKPSVKLANTVKVGEIVAAPVQKTIVEGPNLVKSYVASIEDKKKNFQEDNLNNKNQIPIIHDNDFVDDYYPDFTSDNYAYVSSKEYDWNNFHDKNFYAADHKAELSRERRKYDRIYDNNILRHYKGIKNQISKELKDFNEKVKSSIEELQFRIPPGLDFPDFKTEMVNKEKYMPKIDIYYQPGNHNSNELTKYYDGKMSTYSNKKSPVINTKVNGNDKNNVETVFARSKVVKYGQHENNILKPPDIKIEEKEFKRDKNLISKDGDTIYVIAKSVGYPNDLF